MRFMPAATAGLGTSTLSAEQPRQLCMRHPHVLRGCILQRMHAMQSAGTDMAERLQLHRVAARAGGGLHGGASAPKAPAHLAIESGAAAGFQLACEAGPLCQDPLWGVALELSIAVNVPNFDFSPASWASLNLLESSLGPVSGQVHVSPCASLRRLDVQSGLLTALQLPVLQSGLLTSARPAAYLQTVLCTS
jgi:hypothetical protein